MAEILAKMTDDNRDALTGLVGAQGILNRLAAWSLRAAQGGEKPSIHMAMLGLRRFDTVNLAYGEAAGDSALVTVAARILRFAGDELDGEWVVARLSGGNFVIAASESCSRERWQWLVEALANTIAQPIANPTGSGTLSLWPRLALLRCVRGEADDGVLGKLAETLERARDETGRRLLWVDGESAFAGRSSSQLEADLLSALDRDEIAMLYQPQFSSCDNSLVGAEALARWEHPEIGRIGAAALFAIAERADHLAQLSRHIARRALSDAAQWPGDLRLSLNVTPMDLSANSFADELARTVEQEGFSPDRLTLEITEQALVTDLESSAIGLARLVAQGMRVALDDFGAGFCNFRYLKILPLHYLKLDRSMVDGIAEDPRDLAVLRGITAMAQALDLAVIAEGIETEAQRELVAQEGCAFYQGFLRAKPLSADDFLSFAAAT